MEKEVESVFGDHILEEAARRFGLTGGVFKKLGDFENYVFEAERSGQPNILRLTHSSHRSEEDVKAELSWISFLVSEGLEIPQCYLSQDGSMTEVILTGESYFTASLFQKAAGHLPDYRNPADWNSDLFRAWGELTGRMHEATSRYRLQARDPRRPSWDDDELLKNAKNYIRQGDEIVLQRLDEVLAHMRELPRAQQVYGLIHTDIHPRNFFVNNGDITVFDFDDCSYNWFVHDLAIPLYYSVSWAAGDSDQVSREAFAGQFMRAFWNGYRSAYALPSEWLNEISYFMKLRDITLYLVIHKKIDPQTWEPRLQQWMDNIKDRIRRDVPIVELDYSSFK